MALADQPVALDVIDKKTLTVTRHIAIGSGTAPDLAVHPHKPLSYVSFRNSNDIPSVHLRGR